MIKESKNSCTTKFINSGIIFLLKFKICNPKLMSSFKHYYNLIFLQTFFKI